MSSLCTKCATHSQNKLQNAVDDIQEWATDNNMSLNTNKTKELLVTLEERNWTSLVLPSMVTSLNVCPAQSYSDAISCPTCRGRTTSPISCRKQAVGSTRLRELKRAGLSSKDLLTCYFSFVRSKTEYACQVWSTALTIEQSHAVETIQRRAMQIISPHKTYEEALREHRLVTLQQRRNELCNRLLTNRFKSSFINWCLYNCQ